jgi:hypothetical protein
VVNPFRRRGVQPQRIANKFFNFRLSIAVPMEGLWIQQQRVTVRLPREAHRYDTTGKTPIR